VRDGYAVATADKQLWSGVATFEKAAKLVVGAIEGQNLPLIALMEEQKHPSTTFGLG